MDKFAAIRRKLAAIALSMRRLAPPVTDLAIIRRLTASAQGRPKR